MFALLKKEIHSFFASPIGYLVIGVFLILNGLFLWVFKNNFNILNTGIASLESFFLMAPWVLLFLVPAVTMKSFSDEKKQGTLELLLTKPLSTHSIVLGKFLGVFLLILMALLPTLLYVYTIMQLGDPKYNLDVGSTLGSYFGLLFLVASYCAIGVFTSSLTDNQIVAFISAISICLALYYGFEGLANTITLNIVDIDYLGMAYHYNSMSRGIIDTKDLIYFLSVTLGFLVCTSLKLKSRDS